MYKFAEELETTVTPGLRRPAISLCNLSFTYEGAAGRALRNVTFDMYPGEFVVIAGPSGCGKSTLAMALAGHIPHVIEGQMSGSVSLAGKDTRQLDLSDISAKVSLCQQDPEAQFCTLTVADEVSFGPENLALPVREIARRRQDALAAVNGLYLQGRKLFQLSGGEQQRVAIASMLAMEPEVLILDEPTSSLGPDSAREVWSAIEKLRSLRKITIIVVEHKLDCLLSLADRLVIMKDGEIVMDGAPQAIHGQYAKMLQEYSPMPAPPPLRQKTAELSAAAVRETIRVNHLQFSYEKEEVLHGLSLQARAGEFIGIIGPNGSGKTTFLSCLAGLHRPSSGEVKVEGIDVTRARISAIARKVGFVFQSPNHQLFESTVADEVAFACRNFGIDGRLAVRQVMDEYGLTRYASCHPLKLSHGEKRRLNLCSVLPHQPSVILLDEPFIGQDTANTARMLRDLLRLKQKGKTIVMVSHDMETVFHYCDRVLFFEAGQILVDAAPVPAMEAMIALGKTAFLPLEWPS